MPSDLMTWGWGQVEILSLLTLILATGAALLPKVAGVSPWAWTLPPPHMWPWGRGAGRTEEGKDWARSESQNGQTLPSGSSCQLPQVWELSSLRLASSSSRASPLFLQFPGRALLLVCCR